VFPTGVLIHIKFQV